MKEVSWKVELINTAGMDSRQTKCFKDTELLKIYYGFRRCYSPEVDNFIDNDYTKELFIDGCLSDESRNKVEKFIRKMRKTPHETPIEHVNLTFHIAKMSRNCSHQWVRSRIASHSQQSLRYVELDDLEIVIPESIKRDPYALDMFTSAAKETENAYKYLVEERNIPAEDARFIIPNGVATSIVTTMNLRELLHFFSERCCNRSQWEIRDIAKQMLVICKELFPSIFENAGAKCMALHKCPELDSCDEKPYRHTLN